MGKKKEKGDLGEVQEERGLEGGGRLYRERDGEKAGRARQRGMGGRTVALLVLDEFGRWGKEAWVVTSLTQ